MGLAWFGNFDYCDERPPSYAVPVECTQCGEKLTWNQPMNYDGPPPKHKCGGTVKRYDPREP